MAYYVIRYAQINWFLIKIENKNPFVNSLHKYGSQEFAFLYSTVF